MLQGWNSGWNVRRIDASAAIDGAGMSLSHASGISAVIDRGPDGRLILQAIGPTDEIAASARWSAVPALDRRGSLLLPGLVNAHAHLDLTHLGPRPHDPAEGFLPWIDMIRRERLTEPGAISASVLRGVERSLAGGTVLIGDIAGAVAGKPSPDAAKALADDARINAVAFIEFFAQGARGAAQVAAAHGVWSSLHAQPDGPGARVTFGLQPHAPYSVGLNEYEDLLDAIDPETPVCTHLAESDAERRFIADGAGPFRALLQRVGTWDATVAAEVGHGRTPIEHLTPLLAGRRIAAVHCNDASATDLALLARAGAPIVYCPRSSAYFAADRHFGPHRYRDMLAAGLAVALGTDSIVNLETPDRISVWDEMRLLALRDGTDPALLLRMATVNGAAALRRNSAAFALTRLGTLAGLLAVPVPPTNQGANPVEMLKAALQGDSSPGGANTPELIAIGRV